MKNHHCRAILCGCPKPIPTMLFFFQVSAFQVLEIYPEHECLKQIKIILAGTRKASSTVNGEIINPVLSAI
jgi:hypothetical protein